MIAGGSLLRPAADFLRPQATPPSQEGLLAWWKAEPAEGDELVDRAGQLADPISGNYRYGEGSSGGLKLDGFSAGVTREAGRAPMLTGAFTLEARVALAAFPWNWCAVVAQQRGEQAGFFFGVGPRGEIGLHMRMRGGWGRMYIRRLRSCPRDLGSHRRDFRPVERHCRLPRRRADCRAGDTPDSRRSPATSS